MKTIINRKNHMFVIDRTQLSTAANKDSICNALYGAIYMEFKGANTNPTYKGLTPKDMLLQVNIFANDWLKTRKLA